MKFGIKIFYEKYFGFFLHDSEIICTFATKLQCKEESREFRICCAAKI